MLFSRKPYQIDSVYYMDNTLKIGCDCQAFSETLTGCKDCFKDAKGRITVSVFSPANNIISVRVLSHHAEPKTKGYSVIDLVPPDSVHLKTQVITSLSRAVISKQGSARKYLRSGSSTAVPSF